MYRAFLKKKTLKDIQFKLFEFKVQIYRYFKRTIARKYWDKIEYLSDVLFVIYFRLFNWQALSVTIPDMQRSNIYSARHLIGLTSHSIVRSFNCQTLFLTFPDFQWNYLFINKHGNQLNHFISYFTLLYIQRTNLTLTRSFFMFIIDIYFYYYVYNWH